jgi:hypothetical protein
VTHRGDPGYVPRTPKDLRNFLFIAWKFLGLPEPTPLKYEMAHFLQTGPSRACLLAYRGIGKSWITSIHCLHELDWDPQKRLLVVSASKERADAFAIFSRRLIDEMPELIHLQPRVGQRDSRVSFDVAPALADHAPSVKAAGITGQITGSRANEIVLDDVEVPNNSDTQVARGKLSESVKEVEYIIKPGGRIRFLGTPQTEESIYNDLEERGYRKLIIPARYPTAKQRENYGPALSPMIASQLEGDPALEGQPTDPERFGELELVERESSVGRSGFNLQYQLDTTLSDAERYPLKLADLCVTDLDPDLGPEKVVWSSSPEFSLGALPNVGFRGDGYFRPMRVVGDLIPYEGAIMGVDPSGRGKDETTWFVVKYLNGQLFLLDFGASRDGYTDAVLTGIAQCAKRQKVGRILVEDNFGGGMFTKLLVPHLRTIHPCTTEDVTHSKQKELRIIDTLEPVMNQHKLIVDKRLIMQDYLSTESLPAEQQQRYRLFYQLTRVTKERGALVQDDRLDGLALAAAYWTEQMGRDIDGDMKSRQEALIDAELADFLEHAVGGPPKRPAGWIGHLRR